MLSGWKGRRHAHIVAVRRRVVRGLPAGHIKQRIVLLVVHIPISVRVRIVVVVQVLQRLVFRVVQLAVVRSCDGSNEGLLGIFNEYCSSAHAGPR